MQMRVVGVAIVMSALIGASFVVLARKDGDPNAPAAPANPAARPATAAPATPHQPLAPPPTLGLHASDDVVPVEAKNVCMMNDRSMANAQIPVKVAGKTYYGCCPMCEERLATDEAARVAVDPVSGNKVDKAEAVIGALPGAAVLYFENRANLEKYNAGVRAPGSDD